MFELNYRLVLSFDSNDKIDYSKASEAVLRSDVALGDILVRGDQADFSTNTGGIPILDFAYCLNYTKNILLSGKNKDIIDFAEGEDQFYFELKGEDVFITTSHKDGIIGVSFREFQDKVDQFYTGVKEEVLSLYPYLNKNSKFLEWYHRKMS